MALDEPNEHDETYDIGGFTYVVEKALMDRAKPITIDSTGRGFAITSSMVFGGGCGGCGSTSSCCY